MKNEAKNYYKLFLKTGDPMCLLLSRDFKKTEDLRKQVLKNNGNTL